SEESRLESRSYPERTRGRRVGAPFQARSSAGAPSGDETPVLWGDGEQRWRAGPRDQPLGRPWVAGPLIVDGPVRGVRRRLRDRSPAHRRAERQGRGADGRGRTPDELAPGERRACLR